MYHVRQCYVMVQTLIRKMKQLYILSSGSGMESGIVLRHIVSEQEPRLGWLQHFIDL